MYKITFSNSNLGQLQLQHLPTNIDEIQSYFMRSEKYYGVLRQIEDVSFIWVKEAADYIRNIVNAYGVQSEITISMQYTDNNIDFEQFYSGILDLKAFTDDTVKIECRIISSSAESKLLNNLDTQYKLYLPSSLKIKQRDNIYFGLYQTTTSASSSIDSFFVQRLYYNSNRGSGYAAFEALRTTGDSEKFNNIIVNSFYYVKDLEQNADAASLLPFAVYNNYAENSQLTVSVDQDFKVYSAVTEAMTNQVRFVLTAMIFNRNGEVEETEDLLYSAYMTPNAGGGGTVIYQRTIQGVVTLTNLLSTNQKVALLIRCQHTGISPTNGYSNISYSYQGVGQLLLTSTEYKTETEHRAIGIRRAFNRLIESTQTNQSGTSDPTINYVDGNILTSERYGRTVITSGLELRKSTNGNGEMVTSISDLWDSLNVPFCLGMGLKKQGDSIKVTIDHRTEFFKPIIVYDLGEVTDFKCGFDESFVQNVLNIIYPGVDNSDYPNGIYEYLTKYGYTLPSNYIDNSLKINCPYKVDATSIEKVRTNRTDDTQDSVQDDESNFLIRCYLSGETYYNSRGEEFDSISQTGLQNNTQIFNVDMFAPVALRFWAWWILSGLKYYPSTDELVMQRNYPNASVSIIVDGITCDTNNISLAKLKQLAAIQDYLSAKGDMFEPFAYTFKAPVTVNFINIYNNERHGVLKFSYKNVDYYGFGMKIPALPKKSGEFRLLKLSKRGKSLCV